MLLNEGYIGTWENFRCPLLLIFQQQQQIAQFERSDQMLMLTYTHSFRNLLILVIHLFELNLSFFFSTHLFFSQRIGSLWVMLCYALHRYKVFKSKAVDSIFAKCLPNRLNKTVFCVLLVR